MIKTQQIIKKALGIVLLLVVLAFVINIARTISVNDSWEVGAYLINSDDESGPGQDPKDDKDDGDDSFDEEKTPKPNPTGTTPPPPEDACDPGQPGCDEMVLILNEGADPPPGCGDSTSCIDDYYGIYYVSSDDEDTSSEKDDKDDKDEVYDNDNPPPPVEIDPENWIWVAWKYDLDGDGEIDDSTIDPYIGGDDTNSCWGADNWINWKDIPLGHALAIQQFNRATDTSVNYAVINNNYCRRRSGEVKELSSVLGISTGSVLSYTVENETIPADVLYDDAGSYLRTVIPEGFEVKNWAEDGTSCQVQNDEMTAFRCRDIGDNDDGDDILVLLIGPENLECASFEDIFIEGTGGQCTPLSSWESGDSVCYTQDANVIVRNDVTGALNMSLTDVVPVDEWCIDMESDDSRWQNVSLATEHDWTVDLGGETSGEAKVCAKFTNDVSSVQCGGMIHVIDPFCTITVFNGPSELYPGQEGNYSILYDQDGTNPQNSSVDYTTSQSGILDPNSHLGVPVGGLSGGGYFGVDFTADGEIDDKVDITVTAQFETLDGDTVTCDPLSKEVTIVPRPGWWQVVGADIWSIGDIISQIPPIVTNFLNRLGLGGYSGIAITGSGIVEVGDDGGEVSEGAEDWIVHTAYKGDTYGYDYFESKVISEVKEKWLNDIGIISSSEIDSNGLVENCTNARVDGYCWLKREGNLTLKGQNLGDEKIVLFVEGGTLRIDEMITLNDGTGFLMAIVGENDLGGGNITVAILDDAGGDDPELEGIFVADNLFSTGGIEEQLKVRGSVVAWQGIELQRNLRAGNEDFPAELFEYAPDLYLLIPFGEREMEWKEVAP